MNYVQINIGGKDRGLKFNRFSMEIYANNIDIDKPLTSSVYATFYAGLYGNCYVKREEPDFTFEDVCDWVDEFYEQGKEEEIKSVCTTWVETNVYKDWLNNLQEKAATIERDATT